MTKIPKKYSGRIPHTVGGIQVNFCKDPKCRNFGCPALVSIKGKPLLNGIGKGGKPSRDRYTISSRGKGLPELSCNGCEDTPPMKSNKGIVEELARMTAYLDPRPPRGCSTPGCMNADIDVDIPVAFQRFGTTASGSQRYRCRSCGRVRSVPSTTIKRQRKSHKNKTLFKCLVNKVPLRRICEIAEINISSLYDKIDFFQRQCLAFGAHMERRLQQLPFNRLYISVDRQVYSVNWNDTNEKRNILLQCVGSADNRSSYIFGMHLNFDPGLVWSEVEREAKACGDLQEGMPPPFRTHARQWLLRDYEAAAKKKKNSIKTLKRFRQKTLADSYVEAFEREDIEASEEPTLFERLPKTGMQIRSDYTLYGHFFFLKKLLPGARKIRFFMEKESGIRAACHAAFAEDILSRRCDAFYVKINKDLNTHQKMIKLQEGRWELDEFRAKRPEYEELSDSSLRVLMVEERLVAGKFETIGPFKDRWLEYPAPQINEPEKMVCHLTDIGGIGSFPLAKLYVRASLHGIDRFMMQIRRRLSLLERPISTSSNVGRRWYGYCPYRPEMITKTLEILRVYYNFVLVGEDKKTPAMRIGLAERPATIEEILYFIP